VGLCLKCEPYGLKYTIEFAVNLEVAEAENAIAEIVQGPIARVIATAVIVKSVLVSIYLDDQARPATLEIHDVIRDRGLTAEVMTNRAQFAQFDP
jgi:hypothetical protein